MRKQQRCWGVSVIGEYHIANNMVNQDAFAFEQLKTGFVVAVSDGLGSKKHSDFGSQMACKAVLKAAKRCFNDLEIKDLLKNIHSCWLNYIVDYEIFDCNATCLFALKYKNKIILGQLGDGAIVAVAKEKNQSVVLLDNKVDSFSNVTHCLNEKFNFEQWKTLVLDAENIQAVVLYTDGIADDIPAEFQIDFAREFHLNHKYLRQNQRVRKIKKMLQEWHESGSTDDKTIAVLNCERRKI